MQKMLLTLCCILALCGIGHATQWPDTSDLEQSLPAAAQQLLGEFSLENTDFSAQMQQLLRSSFEKSGTYFKQALSYCGKILAIVLLCSLIYAMEPQKTLRIASLAGAMAITWIGCNVLRSMTQTGNSALADLKTYCDLLLPALSMVTASCGGFQTAAVLQVGTVAFISFLSKLITAVLQPLVFVYLALACGEAAMENRALESLRQTVGWFIRTGLKTVLFLFTAYLAISGAISGNADAMTIRTAKLTLSGVVPVVGSMLSDASETLVVSAGALRDTIGVFGMLGVTAICILPFLQTGITYLAFKLTAGIAGLFDRKQLSALTNSLASAAGFLTAMTGSCAFMLFICFVSYIKVVTI